MKKSLRFILSYLFFIIGSQAKAQQDSVITYPTPGITSAGGPGVTFEITSTAYINIHQLQMTANLSGDRDYEIYYRIGNVQHIPGALPDINGNGWMAINTITVPGMVPHVPKNSAGDLDWILPPGTYGVFIHAVSNSGISIANWNSTHPTTYTNAAGKVAIHTGPNKGYLGNLSIFSPRDTVNFVGGFVYSILSHLPNDVSIHHVDDPFAKCGQQRNIDVVLRNLGSTQILSLDINYRIDGGPVQTFAFTGLIDTIGSVSGPTKLVTIGTMNLTAGQDYNLEVWTSSPNGMTDPVTSNDSATAHIYTALSGTYTIDSSITTNTNFKTFNAAAAELKTRGVCGPVVFNVKEGVYNEHVVFDAINGASAINTITIQPDPANSSPVELHYDSPNNGDSNYVVKLNGASYMIFDGLEMYADDSTDSHTSVFIYENASHHNTVRNCELIAPTASSTGRDYAVIMAFGDPECSHNIVKGNYVYGGSYGITFRGSSTQSMEGVYVSSNTIKDVYYYGIYIYDTQDAIIEDNVIESNSNRTSSTYAIRINYSNGVRITGNTVRSPGIYPQYGMRVENSNGTPAQKVLIANNMIHAGNFSSGSGSVVGLYLTNSAFQDIVHNNVVVEGYSFSSRAAYIYNDGNDTRVFNNNFLHYGIGYAVAVDSGTIIMDYNNLASSGAYLAFYGGGRGAVPDLVTWQLTGNGANSINVDSMFTNLDSLRTCDNRIIGAGVAWPGVTIDIDGDARNNPPNIGADEFPDLNQFSLGPDITFCAGEEVTLGNNTNAHYGNFTWSTSDTTRTITVTDAGTYSVTVEVCGTATDDITLTAYPSPAVAFTASKDSANNNTVIGFTNNTTDALGYLWDFGDSTTSTSKDAHHSYSAFGTYTVTLTAYGLCDTVTETMDIYVGPIGISELNGSTVKIYPNPANDILFIQFSKATNERVLIQLLDVQGRIVVSRKLQVVGNVQQLDVSDLHSGMYVLKITGETGVVNERIVIE